MEMTFPDGRLYNPLPVRRNLIQVDSVQRWMDDLMLMTECECMCILQSKPISVEDDSQSELMFSPPESAQNSLEMLLKRAWIISTELTKIVQKLERSKWRRIHCMTVKTSCHVRSMIKEYNTLTKTSSDEMQQYESVLMDKCSELAEITERCTQTDDEDELSAMKLHINEALTSVGQYFSQLINLALIQEIKNLVKQLETCDSLHSMESAIHRLFSLTKEGSRLCYLVAQEGAVVALFRTCRQDCFRGLWPSALRTLAAVCCAEEGVYQLEKVDGILCLTDILTDESQSEACRAEAAAVIAQITSPHLTFTQHLSSFIENMEEIVTALLRLCREASSAEVFLLASAALANITFLDTLSCEMLLHMNAIKVLLRASSDKQRVNSSYARDQIVTILANMSILDQCSSEIIEENGIPRLIQLCRSPDERHGSEAVLVACLAALRRLATLQPDGLEDSDLEQLVKPRLVDSFLLCSNMEESFV